MHAPARIAEIRSHATAGARTAEMSKEAVHALMRQMLAIADTSLGGFGPMHAQNILYSPGHRNSNKQELLNDVEAPVVRGSNSEFHEHAGFQQPRF
jgi:hypothetical protein